MDIAKYIDHTLLKADAKEADILRLCDEAAEYGFASVCVNPRWAESAAKRLEGGGVKLCCVVGFPLGATASEVKAAEAAYCLRCGAEELDMVMDIGAAKAGNWDGVRADIAAVSAVKGGALLKVIIECCLLTDEEKRLACRAAVEAGADFVKTSTGFSTGGATAADVRLMRETVGDACGVKAAGGIRDRSTALELIAAGANRLGASAGIAIVRGE